MIEDNETVMVYTSTKFGAVSFCGTPRDIVEDFVAVFGVEVERFKLDGECNLLYDDEVIAVPYAGVAESLPADLRLIDLEVYVGVQ